MTDLNWEAFMWQPDPSADPEPELLDSPAQRAHRLSTVESVFASDEQSLAEWHRRPRV